MALFSGATSLRLPRPDQALPGRDAVMPVPGAHFVNGARFRVDQTLSPGSAAPLSGTLTVSYIRQVLPPRSADPELQRGSKYILFGTLTGRRLHALKIVPHSDEAVRIVASALAAGARHESRT